MIAFAPTPEVRNQPFDHIVAPSALPTDVCATTLEWLETGAPWKLRVASFYEQWEFHLDTDWAPASLQALWSRSTIDRLRRTMIEPLCSGRAELTEITAHKLLSGQTIRIHNDYLEGQETHRLIVQLNRGWQDDQGGMLMLFSSGSPDDVSRVIRPLHGSAFAFRISPRSFHAVSTIRSGERYTLVYSFRESAEH